SPTTVPPSSSASSARVRVIIGAEASVLSGSGSRDELLEHVAGQVHALVDVDDESSGAVEDDVVPLVAGNLLHRRADLVHYFVGGGVVGQRGLPARSPHVLDELLVVADLA